MRHRSLWFTAVFGMLCVLYMSLTTPIGTDFPTLTEHILKNLGDGNFPGYFQRQPEMGQFSLLVRWPAALLFPGQLTTYRVGAGLCLLGPLLLAVHLGRSESSKTASLICIALILNPVTVRALKLGHPEELLCASLCVGSLVAVIEGRFTMAGVLLGLALATKQWALLAVLPILFAAGKEQLWRIGAFAVAIAAVFTLPGLIIDSHAFFYAMNHPINGVIQLRPGNFWSLVYGPQGVASVGDNETVAFTNVPHWLRHTAHPGIIVICVAVTFACRRFVTRKTDWLLVMAIVFLVRCAIDPWNHAYYHAPMLMALCCWEVIACRRSPSVTIVSTAVLWLVFEVLASGSSAPERADVVYILWAVAICIWMVQRLVTSAAEPELDPGRSSQDQNAAPDPKLSAARPLSTVRH